MYRRYENPYTVEHLLYDAKADYENAKRYSPDDNELLTSIAEEVKQLEERLRIAWADYEEEGKAYSL